MSAYPPARFLVGTSVVLTQSHGRYTAGNTGKVRESWRTAPGNPHFYSYHIWFDVDGGGDMSVPETKLKRLSKEA
ncbi:hypothetical protein CPB85DRAFT_1442750 [Mucidula mucida]|nr:hypothetical protein CPB85DRAFT_1442750 [Mucidula mucida]